MITNLHEIEKRRVGYSVNDIATPTVDLICWDLGSEPNDTIRQASEKDITYVPVRDKGLIRGKIILDALRRGERDFERLTSEQLISHDAPILHVIELFAQEKDRIFFVLSSNEITGLVAPADLNKVPALASIYLLIAHFETSLIELISEKLGKDEDHIRASLEPGQLDQLKRWHKDAKVKDVDLPLIHYAGLKELTTIVSNASSLREIFADRWKDIEKNIDALVKIRNSVAHPNKPLIGSRDDLSFINVNIQMIIDVILCVQPLLNPPPADASVAHRARE